MDQSEKLISKIEGDTKPFIDEVNKIGTEKGSPFAEKVNEAEETLIENVKSSPTVTQLEKEVEKFVSDPWASLKNLGTVQPESSSVLTSDVLLTTAEKNVTESSETTNLLSDETILDTEKMEHAEIDENPRSMHTQPFVAVAAGGNVSWMNCCGLLDVVRRSDE